MAVPLFLERLYTPVWEAPWSRQERRSQRIPQFFDGRASGGITELLRPGGAISRRESHRAASAPREAVKRKIFKTTRGGSFNRVPVSEIRRCSRFDALTRREAQPNVPSWVSRSPMRIERCPHFFEAVPIACTS